MIQPGAFRRWRAELALVVIAFLWGSTFVLVKNALADASTLVFLALRFIIAAALLYVIFRKRLTKRDWAGDNWVPGLITAFLLFMGYALQTAGLRLTTASKSAFITGLYVVLVPLFGSYVSKVAPRMLEILGVAMAVAGTALMTTGGLNSSFGVGEALTVGCAVAFAAHMLAVERYSRRMGYEVFSLLQVAGVGLFSLAGLWWVETPRLVLSERLTTALAITAVLATALSFSLYTWAQRQTTATRAALIFSSEPVFAGLTAWAVAGEAWTARSLSGAGLILAGILAVELKPGVPERHPSG